MLPGPTALCRLGHSHAAVTCNENAVGPAWGCCLQRWVSMLPLWQCAGCSSSTAQCSCRDEPAAQACRFPPQLQVGAFQLTSRRVCSVPLPAASTSTSSTAASGTVLPITTSISCFSCSGHCCADVATLCKAASAAGGASVGAWSAAVSWSTPAAASVPDSGAAASGGADPGGPGRPSAAGGLSGFGSAAARGVFALGLPPRFAAAPVADTGFPLALLARRLAGLGDCRGFPGGGTGSCVAAWSSLQACQHQQMMAELKHMLQDGL